MEQGPKQRPCQPSSSYSIHSLFDKSTQVLLEGLNFASCNSNNLTEIEEPARSIELETETKLSISESKFCNACQTQFVDREEQLLHYKSDWHRYNLHLRLRGASSVTEDQFDIMSGDVSSISGSDDDDEKDSQFECMQNMEESTSLSDNNLDVASPARQRESHKVFFRNKNGDLMSFHRCLLHHKKNPIHESNLLIAATAELPKKSKWAVLMVTCGHFAGAIFDGNEILEHKTFHRYTVRKKRGTTQSSHDNKGQHANSAGANLRRYNEAALVQEVQELLSKWQDHLKSCNFVFVRIPVANRGMFYAGKNAPFQKDDMRIRVIPFPTRRPTFSELKRVHQMLSCVECYGKEADFGSTKPRSPRKYFDKVLGQLEVRHPSPEGEPQENKNKTKPSSIKARNALQECPPQDEPVKVQKNEDEDKIDMDLIEATEEVSFLELKEFEHSPKRKRNKVKEKDTKSKIVDLSLDEREIRWKNSLYTASKTGNENIFNTIINEMRTHYKEEMQNVISTDSEANCESRQCFASDQLLPRQDCLTINSSQNGNTQLNQLDSCESSLIEESNGSISATSRTKSDSEACLEQIADFLNKPLGEGGQSLLHVASRENQDQLVLLLLQNGANPALKDKAGKVSYNLGGSEVRNVFRRFMSLWPDRYDYAAAQVPSPLTEEMEVERKRKAAEKRKAKKKAANERNKEKKAAEALVREEQKEKDRFLALSDREKRALAAERRILQQHTTEGSVKPVLSRCWQCAVDITGKIPFEYSDYKFCSTKCLREHRSKQR
ncbi:ankyrin repeat and Zinc finger domain-containing protein 1-like [Plakobranchus ocellatus]|uniref:Ankyrin repeat and Zinc finger domain-containing protein 1-like n=1 Tax=Plakobranchus ocellatus TaxID=259542 RepID=A0AAV4CJ33_9GAST|nr:ankyrin repeat and Zinc finger domain-containing protein 1-like [Plakobranchus ocellatus]